MTLKWKWLAGCVLVILLLTMAAPALTQAEGTVIGGTVPITISGVGVTGITGSGATITWTTNGGAAHLYSVFALTDPASGSRGISGFTSAMTRRAFSAALFTMSTDTPKLHRPRASGGVTWMSATSSGSCPELKRRGMSDRWIGV